MFQTTKALVLREVRYKEADRILTLLSESGGKMTAKARSALRKSSRSAAATQQLTWSELTLFGNRGKWTVNEGSVLEGFDGLRQEMPSFALGCYIAECLDAFSVEDQPDAPLLQLGLNSLFALSRGLCDRRKVKAAFELRLMCLSGFEPRLDCCAVCAREKPEEPVLGLEHGGICCRACRKAAFGGAVLLDPDSLAAMRYIASAPAKRLFSFSIGEQSLNTLSDACERYLKAHAERGFGTLEYYKQFETRKGDVI